MKTDGGVNRRGILQYYTSQFKNIAEDNEETEEYFSVVSLQYYEYINICKN
jgi:hypothetical protein